MKVFKQNKNQMQHQEIEKNNSSNNISEAEATSAILLIDIDW